MKLKASFLSKTFFVTAIVFITIMMSGCTSSRLQRNANSFYFFQMSDTQFGMFTNNNGFEQETINFEKAIAEANRLHPAFVIVCGDLVNKTGDKDQIAEYKRIAGKLDHSIPLYNVAGNHDVANKPTKESLEDYRKNFGPDYYSFEQGNLYGIVLNSSLFFDSTGAPAEARKQDEWLHKTLEDAKNQKFTNIVIFQHIPWFLDSPDEKDQYFNIPTPIRKKYIDLFQSYSVKYIFAGHLHKNAIGHAKDLEMVTTGPVGKPLGKDPSGFRIVNVKGSTLTHHYYALDSLPLPPKIELSK
jgi:3',5'-cyclic AMP phosphodiesterase CpdA